MLRNRIGRTDNKNNSYSNFLNSLQFNRYVLTGRLNSVSACYKANTKTQIRQEDTTSAQQQNNKHTK